MQKKRKMKHLKKFENKTELRMYLYFTDLIKSPALAKFMTPHRHIVYMRIFTPKRLLNIVGFEEKIINFVSDFNEGLKIYSYDEICDKYDLYDAFVNKTQPIIKKIIRCE